MTEAELDAIEAAVGFPLPPEYRRVAAASPFRPIGRDAMYWFYDTPDWVVGETLGPLADGGYDRTGWQDGYLTIGASAAGDPYVMDTRAAGLPVHLLSHETHAFEPGWPSFRAFVAEWVRVPDEIEREAARRATAEAAARRRFHRLGLLILLAVIGLPLVVYAVISLAR